MSELAVLNLPDMSETRARIIRVAVRLFADEGFDSVSLRQITAAAKANVGAVNYHFRSKDELIKEVFASLAKPVNKMRLTALDEYERSAGDGPLDVEEVARALIAPAVRFASDREGVGFYLTRLLVLARALRRPIIESTRSELYDEIFHRFVKAFSRGLPNVPYEDLCWRYDFTIGAMLHVVGYFDGTSRMERLTDGRCNPRDVERIIEHLVAFVVDGLRSPAVTKSRARSRTSKSPARKAKVIRIGKR